MTTDPRDALVVPSDTSTLSESTREWLDALPLVGGPDQVFSNYMRAAAIEEDREDRERERRRSAALAAREDAAAVAWVRGDVAELVTVAERFRDIAAMTEIEDAQEDARRAKELEKRAAQREQRIAELEAELAKERYEHRRASWLASDRLDGWMAARARAEGYGQSTSYRVRANYWE